MTYQWLRWTLVLTAITALTWTSVTAESFGKRQRRPKPHEYGTVVIDTVSTANNIAAVEFSHWFHRSRYTCRLCHVDIGFAMIVGETRITEADNRHGLYCGTCHNGTIAFGWKDAATGEESTQAHESLGRRAGGEGSHHAGHRLFAHEAHRVERL